MKSNYLCVILHVRRKQLLILPFFTRVVILEKSKMATMFGDVTDPQQRHHPQNIPHLVEKMKGFPLKANSFQKTATYKKPKGGGGVPSTPSPCTTVGVWLCVYVRELKNVKKTLASLTTDTNNKETGYNQRRSTNLILTGWSGTVSSFWRKSSGSWWYSKRNLWSNCNKEKWRIRGIDSANAADVSCHRFSLPEK